jgi:hypothetical protein
LKVDYGKKVRDVYGGLIFFNNIYKQMDNEEEANDGG